MDTTSPFKRGSTIVRSKDKWWTSNRNSKESSESQFEMLLDSLARRSKPTHWIGKRISLVGRRCCRKKESCRVYPLDGLTFPPLGNPPNRKVINVFQADFCRSVHPSLSNSSLVTLTFRPVQLRYNRTISKFGFAQLHEYVLKLIDAEKCPRLDETCPEVEKLDITKCFSGGISSCRHVSLQINVSSS